MWKLPIFRKPPERRPVEPRWPVALTVLLVLFIEEKLPERVRVLPHFMPYVLAAMVVVPGIGVLATNAEARWIRIERWATTIFCILGGILTIGHLRFLVRAMVFEQSTISSGLQLLTSGVGLWVTNVAVFALAYWQMDRGGPEARARGDMKRPDWQFPQTTAGDDAPPDWRPSFVDYLSLALNTAMAFSPTDALPLTSRAKLLMMTESLISLVTVVIVGSRAINILGS